jgi:hypothetical protein
VSAAADRFWLSVQRRVAGLQPDVQAAILRAFKTIRDNLSDADLVKLVEQGGLDRLFTAFDTESRCLTRTSNAHCCPIGRKYAAS